MGVETRSEYPFSVDTWTEVSRQKPYHFLTHAHKDHTGGLDSHGTYPIFCTSLTQRLVCRRYPKLSPSIFSDLEVGEPKVISNEDVGFTVTAFDANHCPGAVMLLFEGPFGNVLHTGDSRLTTECLTQLPPQFLHGKWGTLNCVYLDCTFGNETMVMPSKVEAIEQVILCIWNHSSEAKVYLACDMLGQETLLEAVANAFGVKIFVDKIRLANYYGDLEVVAPDFLTDKNGSTRFEICEGYSKLYERATQAINQAKKEGRAQPLFIRPSAQWYTYGERLQGDGSGVVSAPSTHSSRFGGAKRRSVTSSSTKATRDEFGVWHVCYSMHSSRGELERALEVLNPVEVISTTPQCGACDLTKSALPTNPVTVAQATHSIEQCPLKDPELKKGKKDNSCSPSKMVSTVSKAESPVPLFGSAQFGLPPSPPVLFPSPTPSAVPVTAPPPQAHSSLPSPAAPLLSHVPTGTSPTQNARIRRLFVEPESELEESPVVTKSLPQTPSKRRYGSDPMPCPVDEPSNDLRPSSPLYLRPISMPNPPSASEKESLSVRSKSLSRLPSRRRFIIPDPLPSLLEMKRNKGMS